MGLRSNIITISGTVTRVEIEAGSNDAKAKFAIESKDYKNQVIKVLGSVYGKNNVANLVEGNRAIVIGAPSTKNGALFLKAYEVCNPNEDFNVALLSGYAGYDFEQRTTQNGKSLSSGSIGCDGGTGETSWFKVTTFRKLMDWMPGAMKKGAALGFIGSLAKNSYTPSRGKNAGKEVTEYQMTANELFFFPKSQSQASSDGSSGYPVGDAAPKATPSATPSRPEIEDSDFDAVPF